MVVDAILSLKIDKEFVQWIDFNQQRLSREESVLGKEKALLTPSLGWSGLAASWAPRGSAPSAPGIQVCFLWEARCLHPASTALRPRCSGPSQCGGRQLPHPPLGQDRRLDGLQLRGGLGAVERWVGSCHGSLGDKRDSVHDGGRYMCSRAKPAPPGVLQPTRAPVNPALVVLHCLLPQIEGFRGQELCPPPKDWGPWRHCRHPSVSDRGSLGRDAHGISWLYHPESLPLEPWLGPLWPGSLGRRYLHKLQVLVWQLALWKLVFLGDPRVLQDLLGCEALVRVHMQHLGHQVLGKSRQGGWWERLAGEQSARPGRWGLAKAAVSCNPLPGPLQ